MLAVCSATHCLAAPHMPHFPQWCCLRSGEVRLRRAIVAWEPACGLHDGGRRLGTRSLRHRWDAPDRPFQQSCLSSLPWPFCTRSTSPGHAVSRTATVESVRTHKHRRFHCGTVQRGFSSSPVSCRTSVASSAAVLRPVAPRVFLL